MKKWNNEIRRYVYRRLMSRFGPTKEWGSINNPIPNTSHYRNLLKKLPEELRTLFAIEVTVGAIENQIAWALQPSQRSISSNGHMASYIHNRSVALDVGLIGCHDIPSKAMFQ